LTDKLTAEKLERLNEIINENKKKVEDGEKVQSVTNLKVEKLELQNSLEHKDIMSLMLAFHERIDLYIKDFQQKEALKEQKAIQEKYEAPMDRKSKIYLGIIVGVALSLFSFTVNFIADTWLK